MIKFIGLISEEIERLIKENVFGLEQEYMAIVYRKNPELFNPYYGDFCDILYNYNHCNNNQWLPLRYLNCALSCDDLAEAQKVAQYLINSPNYNGDKQKLLAIIQQ